MALQPTEPPSQGRINILFYLFITDFICIFFDRGEGREEERERNIDVWLPFTYPVLGNLACNPGMCHDWESNQQPCGLQASAQSTEPHQPGQDKHFKLFLCNSSHLRAFIYYLLHTLLRILCNTSFNSLHNPMVSILVFRLFYQVGGEDTHK